MAKEKIWWSIEVTPEGMRALDEFVNREGVASVARIGSRLVEWFASQPDTIKLLIVCGLPDEAAADVARLLLRRHAR